uniref:Peroxin-19 n=1 Tax=Caenorhabditis japonica TaxID=281687 RepID=A0A8R1EFD1_CAEJA
MAGLDMLRSPNSPMEPFMSMIMQTLASKEVMYPPLKEIFDNYPKYLEDHGAELDEETKERYGKQFDVLGKICTEFEKQPEITEVELPEAASEPAGSATEVVPENPEAAEHFEKLGKLLVELQQYGYPPKELVGALPEGWQIDESGLPKVADAAAATEACTIM